MDHVADLSDLLDKLPSIVGGGQSSSIKPVLVSHSFGGLAIMKLMESDPSRASDLSGIAVMCSVPPSGNGPMTMRYLRRSLRDSAKITAG